MLDGPNVDPCPWLSEDADLPFYLWDRKTLRTVETASLSERPRYTAISHTWGRWEKKQTGTVKKARVPGVDDWEVPENTKFEVSSLPMNLSQVPTSTRFIWLDLVCIPQDRSPRAIDEIARQAIIFRNAEHCIIWLNNVQSWEGLRSTITWMSLVFPDVDNKDLQGQQDATSTTSQIRQGACTGLFDPYALAPDISRKDMMPCGWFTSLWTLQELCLRPDMWLCNRNWELLSAGLEEIPVAMNILIALTGECLRVLQEGATWARLFSSETNQPLFDITISNLSPEHLFGSLSRRHDLHIGFLELFELFSRTGLDELLHMHHRHVLNLASVRFCKEKRAEAIMSVLGASDWFAASRGTERNLVLGQYPLEFVREIAAALGASFFDSISISPVSVPDLATTPPLTYRGSLMPFGHTHLNVTGSATLEHKVSSSPLFDLMEEEDHPAVKTWAITPEGSVRLPMVGLLASSHDEEPIAAREEITCTIWLTHDPEIIPVDFDPSGSTINLLEKQATTRYRTFELHKFLRSYQINQGPNYAVQLLQGVETGTEHGILLKPLVQSPDKLFKIGNFATSNRGFHEHVAMAKTTSVNWLVL
jgi:Heterokaryon incompatibility protein (HET)